MCVIFLHKHTSIIFPFLFFFSGLGFFFNEMANHLGPTLQCKLHRKAKASEHEKTEGSEFFNESSFELLKNPRGT